MALSENTQIRHQIYPRVPNIQSLTHDTSEEHQIKRSAPEYTHPRYCSYSTVPDTQFLTHDTSEKQVKRSAPQNSYLRYCSDSRVPNTEPLACDTPEECLKYKKMSLSGALAMQCLHTIVKIHFSPLQYLEIG